MAKLLLPKGYRDVVNLEKRLHAKPEKYWVESGKKRAFQLFKSMAERVPAYKDFLKKNSVNYKKINSVDDLNNVPPVDKDNYLRVYNRDDLCWDGNFNKSSWVISTTSGSTGKPYYFPRQNTQDWQYSIYAELYLRANFNIDKLSTLYIIAFPMGAWIGGLFTYEALKIISEKDEYNLSIITPGIHKKEIIEAVKQLGDSFEQIIIGSYAPFLKDILDDGQDEGINWSQYKLGFVFSAEGFNEVFRDYVIKKSGLKNIYSDTLNHYGTVDLGTMAHETPLSVLMRRLAVEDSGLYKSLFNRDDKLPTFAQYNPELFYFQEKDGHLYCSAYSGIPLVNYDLKDAGGVIELQTATKILKDHKYDINKLTKKYGIDSTVWNLPFVYVYERNDFSVSFYAFQIYPETIRRALQTKSLEKTLTGKFTMTVEYDEEGQQNLIINVELKASKIESQNLRVKVQQIVVARLLKESSEYRETHIMYGERVFPKIVLWPYEDNNYFKPGVKQRWVKK